jgi:hypothetical protein
MPPTTDPFAETQPAWWWRLLFGGSRTKYTPRRYARIAALIGPTIALVVPSAHHLAREIVLLLLILVPSTLVEAWYKRRQRRRDEQLLIALPAREQSFASLRAAGRAVRAIPRTREAGPKAGP